MLHIFFLILLSLHFVSAEVFSATADIEKLIETHTTVVADLPNYIEKLKSRIAYLERQFKLFQREDEEALKDVSNYFQNPLNAFRLIKRLTHDVKTQEEPLNSDSEYIKHLKLTHPHLTFPNREDLIGAAQALVRLQITYQLNVTELSEGKLQDSFSSPMSSEDCFELGLIIYEDQAYDLKHALPWLMEALRKFQQGDRESHLSEVNILEYISFLNYRNGDLESAIDWSIKILALEPDNLRARENIFFYFSRLAEDKNQVELNKDIENDWPYENTEFAEYGSWSRYEGLCRGEFQLHRDVTKRLFCWYSRKQHPFLNLAPIKVEQVYMQPDVFVFHQVISDREIQHVKDMARPKFERAFVTNYNGTPGASINRISKSGWLSDDDSPIVARISQRIADMTGLSMDSAEHLQVANYGIGGQFETHYDYSHEPEVAYDDGTNRIATVLFYMSEVAQGGATVFTELGLSVFPIKNAALFWMNLHPSGEGDRASAHAACPVLRGSKWVSNKWIHQSGQELIKPCNLEFQPETWMRSLPEPLLTSTYLPPL